MSRIVQMQTNFAVGEIDPLLRARIDLKQYYSALETAKNVIIQPQGGARRREGLRYVSNIGPAAGNGVRLVPFEFNVDDSYMFVIIPGYLYVYRDGVLVENINGTSNKFVVIPELTAAILPELRFAQSADTIIFVHEDLPPLKLIRGADHDEWTKSTIPFTNVPYFAFTITTVAGSTLTADSFDHLKVDTTSGNIKVEAMKSGGSSESNVFTQAASYYENQYINVTPFGRLRIVRKVDNHTLECVAEVPLFNTDIIVKANFELERGYEEAWSSSRGWPKAVTFHEGRLWLAGSKSLPSTVWASRVNDFFNFDKGEGLDDAALEATLSTANLNSVTDIFSGRDLQIFTTGGEFYVPQANLEPITPANFIVKVATRNGSKPDVSIVGVDSGTLFIQREGKSLNELAFTDTELAYNTSNVSMLSGHLFRTPVEMAIRRATSTDESDRLMIVNGDDGSMIVFSLLRSQEVTAPSQFTTDGEFISVGVDVDRIFVVVKRTTGSLTSATITVTDYANIAVGAQVTFKKNDGTTILLQAEAAGSSPPSSPSGNTYFFRPFSSDSTTALNIFNALDSNGSFGVGKSGAQVTINRLDPGMENLELTTTDATRLAVTDFLKPTTYSVEYFDDSLHLDMAIQENAVASNVAAPNLANKTVKVILDGTIQPDEITDLSSSPARIYFDRPSVTSYEVGFNFDVEIKTMPVEPQIQSGSMRGFKKRILEVNAELYETQALTVNGQQVSFLQFGESNLDTSVPPFTGIKTVGPLLGFNKEGQITITQSVPLDMTVLALDYKVSVGQ
jgi:hypothetical protein